MAILVTVELMQSGVDSLESTFVQSQVFTILLLFEGEGRSQEGNLAMRCHDEVSVSAEDSSKHHKA